MACFHSLDVRLILARADDQQRQVHEAASARGLGGAGTGTGGFGGARRCRIASGSRTLTLGGARDRRGAGGEGSTHIDFRCVIAATQIIVIRFLSSVATAVSLLKTLNHALPKSIQSFIYQADPRFKRSTDRATIGYTGYGRSAVRNPMADVRIAASHRLCAS